jgi:hypothetical protein
VFFFIEKEQKKRIITEAKVCQSFFYNYIFMPEIKGGNPTKKNLKKRKNV